MRGVLDPSRASTTARRCRLRDVDYGVTSARAWSYLTIPDGQPKNAELLHGFACCVQKQEGGLWGCAATGAPSHRRLPATHEARNCKPQSEHQHVGGVMTNPTSWSTVGAHAHEGARSQTVPGRGDGEPAGRRAAEKNRGSLGRDAWTARLSFEADHCASA